MVRRLNEIRRANRALQRFENVAFLETESDQLIGYAKRDGDNVVIVVVNLDPFSASEGLAIVPAWLGLPPAFRVRDLLGEDDAVWTWTIGRNFVRLEPGGSHVLRVAR